MRKLVVNILAALGFAGFAVADGNIVPATHGVGSIGRSDKYWNYVYSSNMVVKSVDTTNLTAQAATFSNVNSTAEYVGGKAVVVSTNTADSLMIVSGTFTNGQATVTWPVGFGAVPKAAVVSWADDMSDKVLGGSNAIGVTGLATGQFVPKIQLPHALATNLYFVVIGKAP